VLVIVLPLGRARGVEFELVAILDVMNTKALCQERYLLESLILPTFTYIHRFSNATYLLPQLFILLQHNLNYEATTHQHLLFDLHMRPENDPPFLSVTRTDTPENLHTTTTQNK
jgi:hypothetical protein